MTKTKNRANGKQQKKEEKKQKKIERKHAKSEEKQLSYAIEAKRIRDDDLHWTTFRIFKSQKERDKELEEILGLKRDREIPYRSFDFRPSFLRREKKLWRNQSQSCFQCLLFEWDKGRLFSFFCLVSAKHRDEKIHHV